MYRKEKNDVNVVEEEEILYFGLLNGNIYKGLINPCILDSVDSYVEKEIKCRTISIFTKQDNKEIINIIAIDKKTLEILHVESNIYTFNK